MTPPKHPAPFPDSFAKPQPDGQPNDLDGDYAVGEQLQPSGQRRAEHAVAKHYRIEHETEDRQHNPDGNIKANPRPRRLQLKLTAHEVAPNHLIRALVKNVVGSFGSAINMSVHRIFTS